MSTTSPLKKQRKKVATYCYQCVNGPDLLTVEVENGVATKVEPNFDLAGKHPADGKVCVKPYAFVQKLYNPHRILNPKKRTNPKKGRDEDPGWVDITWEEALETITDRLNTIRKKGVADENGNPRMAVTLGGAGTPMWYMGSFNAFMEAWGPIDKSLGAGGTVKCYHTEHVYGELWHRAFVTAVDSPHCNYILSFGNNIDVGGGVTGVRRNADARARGSRRIQFEPHLSVTGASAAEWIPIRPKTDAAVLYAMIHVLLHEHPIENLDVPFLRDRTAAPYLIGPNKYYMRDPESRKPLVWDTKTNKAVPFDTPDIVPALTGVYRVNGIEVGADKEEWAHEDVEVTTAHEQLKQHVAEHTPEWAESISDVSAETIRRTINEFLSQACIGQTTQIDGRELPYRPVAVMLGRNVNNGWGSLQCVWARTVLMVLVGGLEVPGGLLGGVAVVNAPPFERIETVIAGEDGFMDYPFNPTDKENWISDPEMRHAHRTLSPLIGNSVYAQQLGPTTLSWLRMQDQGIPGWTKPNPPDIWFIYRANPLISYSETDRLMDSIAELPFIVSFAYTEDETNHFVDMLLPEALDLESTQLVNIGGTSDMEQFWKDAGWALRQPAIEPRGECRDFTWIAGELAKRTGIYEQYVDMMNAGVLGPPLKTDFYDFSLDRTKEHSVDEVWDAACRAASSLTTGGTEAHGLDWFKENGFITQPFSQLKWYLYPQIKDMGLRFELPYQERMFRIGTQLTRRMHEEGAHWWDKQLEEYEPFPSWIDLNKLWDEIIEKNHDVNAKDYPFWLLTGRSMQYAWGSNVSIQMIKEVADNVFGHDGIIMNAGKAAEMGIEEGDLIEVTSPVNSTQGRARLRQGVRPDAIIMIAQFGHWKTPFAKDLGRPGLNALVPMNIDSMDAGGSSIDSTKVAITRVEAA